MTETALEQLERIRANRAEQALKANEDLQLAITALRHGTASVAELALGEEAALKLGVALQSIRSLDWAIDAERQQ